MVEGGCFAVSSQPPGQDGSGRGEGLSPGWVVPPAEAPGSLSPARPRTPPRTCSGLRPPEEGRAQASRKVREQGEVWGASSFAGPGAPQRGPRRARHPRIGARPARVLHPICIPCALVLPVPARPPRVQASPPSGGRPRPEVAGPGGRAWFPRAVAQPPGSRAWAEPPLAKVAQRHFPATEVLFSLTGCLFPPPQP